ncbi:M20/M25/M40 family metallo-hydrolase [Microbispora sp. NPDC046973]|uniref:M20/M25/M40 family metallo-hydrolase n=1 Tax=Microbispora sp. NPDC046973 TaxID=3155022 RepID=UPI0033FC0DF9
MKEALIDVPRRMISAIAALGVLAAVIMLTAMSGSTMQPLPASAAAGQFSADRALAHLRRFATEPRPLGSPAGDRARDYLAATLRADGLKVQVHRAVGTWSSAGLATFGMVDDIVATLPGTDPTGTVLLAAHYDSAAMGPGASDDGAAVAAMLEAVRALRTGAALRNDLVLLITDGEEDGVLGAEAFVREHPLARAGGVLLNFEARGVSGPSLMFETSRNNAGLVATYADAAPRPRGDSSMAELYRLLPNNTDFTPLTRAGFTGMNFAYIEDSAKYHTAGDSIANLDRGSLQHHGATMLALARAFGGADLTALPSDHDATYFRIFGVMVTYPASLVWPLAAAAVAALAVLTMLARRRGITSVPRVVAGAASAIVPLVAAVALAQGLWAALATWRPAYDAMGGLLHRPLPYRAAVVVMAMPAVLLWYLWARRVIGPVGAAVGALAWPAGLGVVCAQVAPGASFLFALPALSCAIGGIVAVLLPRSPGARPGQVVAATLGAVAGAALLPALAGNVFDGMGLALGGAAALVFALFCLTLLPIADLALPRPGSRPGRRLAVAVPSTGAVLVLALTALGLHANSPGAAAPQRTHLAYVLDADTRTAHWVSGDVDPPTWTRRYVSGHEMRTLPPGYARGELWTGPAQAIDAAGPRVTVLSRAGDTVTLRVAAGRGARSVTLRVDHPITSVTAVADGMRPVTAAVTGTRARTWPGEIRVRGIPPRGARITVRIPGTRTARLTAIAERDGLAAVPGFVPRPPDLVASTREDGELVAVTRTYVI